MLGTELLIVLLSLSSAISWGAGDFCGGLASKRTSAYTVVLVSQFASLLLLIMGVYLFTMETFTIQAALYGGIAGFCVALGLVALYSGLARGPMGVVAPLTAVIAAVVPVLFSLLTSGLPPATDLAGILFALLAVWIISKGDMRGKIDFRDLILPLLAGLGFGLFFIVIARASQESTIWPLVFARSSLVLSIFIVGMLVGKIKMPQRRQLPIIVSAGVFDTGGSILFILAARLGRLDIAAVLSSLYPAATVFLALILLKERLSRRQWFGVALVILAVVLIAI